MSKVIVDIAGHKPYDVRIATGAIEGLGAALRALDENPQALIITDATVAPHYLKPVKASLEAASYRTFVLTVPAGEEAKSIECAAEITERDGRLQAQSRFAHHRARGRGRG